MNFHALAGNPPLQPDELLSQSIRYCTERITFMEPLEDIQKRSLITSVADIAQSDPHWP